MDPAYSATHIEEDRQHWWFRGRLEIILAAVRSAVTPGRLRLLELGCGTGNVLEALAPFGETVGMEVDETLRAAARRRGLDVRPGALPATFVVEPGWADVVLLLDVLEHLDDEAATLETARALLRPGGVLLVTVPAYQWLWTFHDVTLGHRRRYTARRLRRVVDAAGFHVDRVSYFSTLLFPAIAAVRLLHRLTRRKAHDLSRPPRLLNSLLERLFAAERHVVPTPGLPFGSSIVLIGRR